MPLHVLIIRRSKLYYTASGIITPIGGRLVHETTTYTCDDTRGCVMQFWPPDDEHMCSKHVEAWNKLIVKQKFCASSWLITEMHIPRYRAINIQYYNHISEFSLVEQHAVKIKNINNCAGKWRKNTQTKSLIITSHDQYFLYCAIMWLYIVKYNAIVISRLIVVLIIRLANGNCVVPRCVQDVWTFFGLSGCAEFLVLISDGEIWSVHVGIHEPDFDQTWNRPALW